MKTIHILGTGCPKCNLLAKNAEIAVRETEGLEFEIVKVTDINEILGFGVMITPALVIDGEIKSTGKALSVEDIKAFLTRIE
jgi:small redox-active disulfide protein 2